MKHSLRITIASVLTALPIATFAYLAPEQVFDGITTSPPTARDSADRVRDQQRASAEARAAAQADPEPEEEFMPAAPPDPSLTMEDDAPSLLDDEGQWERRQERLDDNRNGGTTIIIQGNGQYITDPVTGEVLHSGAPVIIPTGPKEFMAIGAILLAATATFLWAARKQGKAGTMVR